MGLANMFRCGNCHNGVLRLFYGDTWACHSCGFRVTFARAR